MSPYPHPRPLLRTPSFALTQLRYTRECYVLFADSSIWRRRTKATFWPPHCCPTYIYMRIYIYDIYIQCMHDIETLGADIVAMLIIKLECFRWNAAWQKEKKQGFPSYSFVGSSSEAAEHKNKIPEAVCNWNCQNNSAKKSKAFFYDYNLMLRAHFTN